MEMELNIESPIPVYEQIVQQVIKGVLDGSLPPGCSLPAIRQLAHDLELNHNTVARAYRLLERQRVIQTAGRKGTFVQEKAASNVSKNSKQEAEFKLDELMTLFKAKGMSTSEMRKLLRAQLKQL